MAYEDELIRESTGEGMASQPWCSKCEHYAEDCTCEDALPPVPPLNPLSGATDEWYQIALDLDRSNGSKLSALMDERDALKRDIIRLQDMITQILSDPRR